MTTTTTDLRLRKTPRRIAPSAPLDLALMTAQCHGIGSVLQIRALLCARESVTATPGSIQKALNVATNAGITCALDALEKLGLLTRQHSSEDRRQVFILLTQQGRDLADNLARLTA